MIRAIALLLAARARDHGRRFVRDMDALEARAAELEAGGMTNDDAWNRLVQETLGEPEPTNVQSIAAKKARDGK